MRKEVIAVDEKMSRQSIDRLDISNESSDILKKNKVITLGELCKKTKKELKELELKQNDIKDIEKELQLLGLNLKIKI